MALRSMSQHAIDAAVVRLQYSIHACHSRTFLAPSVDLIFGMEPDLNVATIINQEWGEIRISLDMEGPQPNETMIQCIHCRDLKAKKLQLEPRTAIIA